MPTNDPYPPLPLPGVPAPTDVPTLPAEDEVLEVIPEEVEYATVQPQALNTLTGVVPPNPNGGQYIYTPPTSASTQAPVVEDKPRVSILKEAASLITGDREQDYGTPQVNFQRIADLWNVQLAHLLAPGKKIGPVDVALAMLQVKLGRAVQSPKRDTFVDIAGYAGLAFELSEDSGE